MSHSVIIAGSPKTGKTAFITRLTMDKFVDNYEDSIGKTDIQTKYLLGGSVFSLYEYSKTSPTSCDTLIVFMSLTEVESILYANKIITEISHKQLIICVSFCDDVRFNSTTNRSSFPISYGFPENTRGYFISAKTGGGITLPFIDILRDAKPIESAEDWAQPKSLGIDMREFMKTEAASQASSVRVDFANSSIILEY